MVLFDEARKWQVNICARRAGLHRKGQLRTRSWEDNGITRYVTEILVKTTGTGMRMLGRVAGAQNSEEGNSSAVSLGGTTGEPVRKRRRKRASRGRKATQPESRSRNRGDDYGFSDDTRSERLTVTTAPSCAGHHRRR